MRFAEHIIDTLGMSELHELHPSLVNSSYDFHGLINPIHTMLKGKAVCGRIMGVNLGVPRQGFGNHWGLRGNIFSPDFD